MTDATPKVLVVGDTPRWINSVKATLPKKGIRVSFCTDLAGTIQILYFEERKFNLLILALCLGTKDEGLRILREFRLHDKITPIIFFSDVKDKNVQLEIINLGGIIVRPQNLNGASPELAKEVTKLLGVTA